MPALPQRLERSFAKIERRISDTQTKVINTALPTGTILMFSSNSQPDGYLICDGSAVQRTVYTDLFNVIGTAYGDGDGSTTFNLPNLVQSFPRGNTGVATTGGSDAHHHGLTAATANITFDGVNLDSKLPAAAVPFQSNNRKAVAGAVSNPATNTVNSTSLSGTTDDNDPDTSTSLPPYIDLLFIIKY